ncbi:hypothetical protein C1752_01842 [Acaryochloris thomasi RCC1774]|uniref:Uncharacterized protein n=1 Tax=Acaryochloris thomasi RCC1774 TaxID=1764569 RepID=A0A2W1JKZ3_9CYAN|nr:hypothetical protein C1752_01842 [Acaryochloris thomasi RCC1774]
MRDKRAVLNALMFQRCLIYNLSLKPRRIFILIQVSYSLEMR